jgi:hypothetical protein
VLMSWFARPASALSFMDCAQQCANGHDLYRNAVGNVAGQRGASELRGSPELVASWRVALL